MMAKAATTTLRRCIGSARFGIEPHEAAVADFPKQPSQKDGLGRMCAEHWRQYVKALNAERKVRATSGETATTPADAQPSTTKPRRHRRPMASKPAPTPESPRVRKARETLAATEALAGSAYTEAVASDEVQAALETLNGHGTSEPDDGSILVAGVLYDTETLEEVPAPVETPLGETIDGPAGEADAA
jgi:hypothetical protein